MKNTQDSQIIFYQTEDGTIQIETRLQDETVWLTQEQMAELFQKNRTVITRHINNTFRDGELDEISNVQKMHFPFSDKPTKIYSLDVIISVGYRVKSKRGTQFRVWANKVLKEYLIKGYALNEKLLEQQKEKLIDLNKAIKLISSIAKHELLSMSETESLLLLLERYSDALNVLDNYDYQRFNDIKIGNNCGYKLEYNEITRIIIEMRKSIGNSDLFGREKDESLKSSISAIYQTFDGHDLYLSIEEKSANLLYFLVKNHSFVDGNKRIAAALFLYFLDKNNILNKSSNTMIIDNNSLVALTLMIANSNPKEKDLIVNIVSYLLQNQFE